MAAMKRLGVIGAAFLLLWGGSVVSARASASDVWGDEQRPAPSVLAPAVEVPVEQAEARILPLFVLGLVLGSTLLRLRHRLRRTD
jgi:hypothetical protein